MTSQLRNDFLVHIPQHHQNTISKAKKLYKDNIEDIPDHVKDLVESSRVTSLNIPFTDGEVDYGDRAEHCWNGDHENPNAISRLRYNSMYVPKIMERIEKSAPKNADLKSWRYR